MTQNNSAFWDQALRARDKLEEEFGNCPAVDFIDIGYAQEGDEAIDVIALRIHLQEQAAQGKFPPSVDGIPVVAVKRK
jgi:hypothetical protein